jgi:hypothetical protein
LSRTSFTVFDIARLTFFFDKYLTVTTRGKALVYLQLRNESEIVTRKTFIAGFFVITELAVHITRITVSKVSITSIRTFIHTFIIVEEIGVITFITVCVVTFTVIAICGFTFHACVFDQGIILRTFICTGIVHT